MTKILTGLLLLTLISCEQAKLKQATVVTPKKINPNWKTFDRTNFSIQYPAEWELSNTAQMGTSFILLSPLESDQDQFRENLNLVIQDLTGRDIDLGEFAEISEKQVKTMITNSTLIESKRVKTNADEYHKIIYTGDQGMYHLKFEQYYRIKNNHAYILTFTAEQNKFSDYKENGEAMLNSFTLK